MKRTTSRIVYSPGDLIRYFASPYASWMDRYHLENPGVLQSDGTTDEQRLVIETGREHERVVLDQFRAEGGEMIEVDRNDTDPWITTLQAVRANTPIIYQAALADDLFEGYADFVLLDDAGKYQVWDTKLARTPKPTYAIQLCCYSEMFAATTGLARPERFGIILGTKDRVEFRVEDFIHYFRHLRQSFLEMQESFSGNLADRPEPMARVDHGRWASHVDKYFSDSDHLIRVAGISSGQIKKLKNAGIKTVADLAGCSGRVVPKLASDSLEKLVAQARLQNETLSDRADNPNAKARYQILENDDRNAAVGLAALPPSDPADVFFDMEGFPLVPGGLEYLFGACSMIDSTADLEFHDWWAHDRAQEKLAFEGFIDWVHGRWRQNPAMHIYHYAPYEVTAVKRLSTFHDTRQDEVDDLLRGQVFVDLYKIVRQGIRLGEESYSIKKVERLYRDARDTDVATGAESIVQYARWMESGQPTDWHDSSILKNIRDYNEDDCSSTHGLFMWLRSVAELNGINYAGPEPVDDAPVEPKEINPEVAARLEIVRQLRLRDDPISKLLGDLTDFHRREEKPMWWRMFERSGATPEELRDDSGCIEGVQAVGEPTAEKQSLVQAYRFDPAQECKLAAGDKSKVMFCHDLSAKFSLLEMNLGVGELRLKIGKRALSERFNGDFPAAGSLLPDEFVSAQPIQLALSQVAQSHLNGNLPLTAKALFERTAPIGLAVSDGSTIDKAISVTSSMSGSCLLVQGPPGTGKTYTAARVIKQLIAEGKKVGVCSNSHKAVVNLLIACGDAVREVGRMFEGVKVGGDSDGPLFQDNPHFQYIASSSDASGAFSSGVIGGTAWLFARPEWEGELDFLFIDEAGQVSLANTIAISRSAANIVLLGDQMQLEQPVQGSHPGDAGLSGLQYALKDLGTSKEDMPIFHAVVPSDYGLFLGESRRMHPAVCSFISDSIYEGRLGSFADCCNQRIAYPADGSVKDVRENGIFFLPIEHDGNIQQSDEEVEAVRKVLSQLLGCNYTATDGSITALGIDDFLFMAPYNAQVRALQAALPAGARVGSVDKFQGQEAPVCILSMCSSYGEYGSRGLSFILDRNRLNVAISRAQCLAVVVGDPRIAGTSVNSLDEMKLLNLYCKLISVGTTKS